MLARGFTDLSYFNVNEYGIDVRLSAKTLSSSGAIPSSTRLTELLRRAASGHDTAELDSLIMRAIGSGESATCATTWQNASECMIESFIDALVVNSWDEVDRRVVRAPYYSWQNSVVVDPGVESYHAFMLEQLVRKIVVLGSTFTGIIIDRSDWMETYNLDGDDGLSFIPEAIETSSDGVPAIGGVASSMKVSYARMTEDLRAVLSGSSTLQARARELLRKNTSLSRALPDAHGINAGGIMLQNTLGTGRLDMFRFFDGQFSEGYAVSGVGILGIASPAILWTYDVAECCTSPASAAAYFQAHLYLGVCPMAPFPGNDHAINWDGRAVALYVRYGFLFQTIATKVWALLPHIVRVINVTNSSFTKVNAFVTVVDVTAATSALEQVLVIPVVFGSPVDGALTTLEITGYDRIWPSGHDVGDNAAAAVAARQTHPFIRQRRTLAGMPGAIAAWPSTAVQYVFEVAYPGRGSTWTALTLDDCTGGSPCSIQLRVPLVEGAAVVRVRRVSSTQYAEQ